MSKSVAYERRLTDSIMVITTDGQGDMDERILMQNRIPGLIPLEKRYMDGRRQYMYNISGKQSLDNYCRIHEIDGDFLEKMIVSTSAQVEIMSKNLLNIDCLMLDPAQVFVSNKNEEILYAVCPGEEEALTTQFRQLMEYLLTRIDHKDMEAVQVAYSLYEKTLDEGYSLADLRDSIAESHARRAAERREEQEKEDAHNSQVQYVECEKQAEPEKKEKAKRFHALLSFLREEVFWEQEAFVLEAKDKLKTYGLIGEERAKKDKKERRKKREKPKSLSEQLLAPEETWEEKRVPEIHPTICLSAVREHPDGLLLYEGYENFSDYKLGKETKIGSGEDMDLVLRKGTVSRMHAQIVCEGEEYYLEDMNSTNGTLVNDVALCYKERRKLSSNDILTFADVKFRFI